MSFLIHHFVEVFTVGAAAFLGFFYFIVRVRTREVRAYQLRRNLFKIRDELRMKIFEGTLAEESRVYQFYDIALNDMLSDTERINAYALIRALTKHGQRLQMTEINEVRRLVKRAHPEVQELIRQFYEEAGSLFVRQSRAFMVVARSALFLSRCGKWLGGGRYFKELRISAEYRDRCSRIAHAI